MSTAKTRTYNDAIVALNSTQSNAATIAAIRDRGVNNSLAMPQMLEWMRRAGYTDMNVFNKLNVVHVTGTKGKGSTCAFVQSILGQYQQPGEQIGLYTSPHLKSVRERIQINGNPISEEKFAKYFFQIWDRIESTESDLEQFPDAKPGVKPGYFRYLTLLSYHVFLNEGVDTAIYEVGIGGEYDSTNIIPRPSVTGVSSLGIDHVAMLGDTIESIAWNKGGIYKPGAPALTVPQPDSALAVLNERATEREAKLEIVPVLPQLDSINLGLQGKFQQINASLAVRLCQLHLNKQGHNIDIDNEQLPEKFVTGLTDAFWAGRCQTINDSANNVKYLIDGAHTKESITESAKWFGQNCTPSAKKVLLFNQQTRDANALVGLLHETLQSYNVQFDHVLFTTNVTFPSGFSADLTSINTPQSDLDTLAVQNALSEAWAQLDPNSQRHVFTNIQDSVQFINSISPVEVLVTGSLHLVGGFLAVHEAL